MERDQGRDPVSLELYPQLRDSTATTAYDPHYAVQGSWVLRGLLASLPTHHVDVGSHVDYLGFFAALVPTTFVDIRPCGLVLPGLIERPGSVLDLPFADASVPSVSCLHVVEHIGLGRYGDPVDPAGLERACAELGRVVAPGGRLYVSTPVGRERLCFNAHRVSDPRHVPQRVGGLQLEQFDLVDDTGTYRENENPADWTEQSYALGLYAFLRT
jgi:SAM-dependent methyltransferase